ncbi:conserved hypothetical protein [Lodderomyces elongisporus NRRL YB-4239]|uniref:Fork-head domain-containing protein n=1 Tax=Lodderomyces elongisporus (strain ATCC 11503 / CBS 2605 / JCM 1781 / NBRC 1676 / NRRL YB-4239) TaxID=379508 RepID=A5DSS6_LODEL|nr:conserved hypothetical protein [Lodderomyces elongisporus NRRL YB-4239]
MSFSSERYASGRVPLLDSTNFYPDIFSEPAIASSSSTSSYSHLHSHSYSSSFANASSNPSYTSNTTTTKTPSKNINNGKPSSNTQTPLSNNNNSSSSNSSKRVTHSQIYDIFNTPLKSVHLDPTIISNFDQNCLIRNTYLSPALSSPQRQITDSAENTLNFPLQLQLQPQSQTQTQIEVQPQTSLAPTSPTKNKKPKSDTTTTTHTPFSLYSEEKPPYSYATLIGISILSHPEKKLTLANIYSWISDTFRFYKKEEVGWQNSIRHNLSLNKAFVKGEKSKDGKGHFWCIKPGYEEQFLKSRSVKKSSYHEVMDQISYATKINAAIAAKKAAEAKAKAEAEAEAEAEAKSKAEAEAEAEAKAETKAEMESKSNTETEETNAGANAKNATLNNANTVTPYIDGKKRKVRQKEPRIPITLLSSPTYGDNQSVDKDDATDHKQDDHHQGGREEEQEEEEQEEEEQEEEEEEEGNLTVLDPPIKKFKSQQNTKDDDIDSAWQILSQTDLPIKLPPITLLPEVSSTPQLDSNPRFIINDSELMMQNSPEKPMLAEKNLTYTSSFSCNSNFELSPLRTSETGPLLEPLTPANHSRSASAAGSTIYNLHYHQQLQLQHQQQQLIHHSLQQHQQQQHHQHQQLQLQHYHQHQHPQVLLHHKSWTPKSVKKNHAQTPLRNSIRATAVATPQTNSTMKKFWNSPSYLDDLYFSPSLNIQLQYSHQTMLHPLSNSLGSSINTSANAGAQPYQPNNHHNSYLQHSRTSSSTGASSHSKLSNITGTNLASYDDDELVMRNLNHPQLSIHLSPILKRAFLSVDDEGDNKDAEDVENGNVVGSRNKNLIQDLRNLQ